MGSHGHSHGSGVEKGVVVELSKKNKKDHSHSHSHGGDHGHSHGHHGHGHSHGGGSKFCGCCAFSDKYRIACMLGMTFCFFLIELITGQITKSISLITDAFHMLSDSLALVIGLVSIVVS